MNARAHMHRELPRRTVYTEQRPNPVKPGFFAGLSVGMVVGGIIATIGMVSLIRVHPIPGEFLAPPAPDVRADESQLALPQPTPPPTPTPAGALA